MSKQLKYYGSSQSLDAVTVAWLAQLTTSFASNPSAAFITDFNTMIAGHRIDGDLTELDYYCIHAQEIQGYARVNIANPASTQITEVNSPVWTANQGYISNNVNRYLNANFNYSTNAVKALRNSISHGVYVRTNFAEVRYDAGVYDTSGGINAIAIASRFSDGKAYNSANAQSEPGAAVANSLGMHSARRTSTATGSQSFRNGVQIATVVDADNALPNRDDFILALNNNGAAAFYNAKQISCRWIGSGAINHLNFYNRFQTFATARGFQV